MRRETGLHDLETDVDFISLIATEHRSTSGLKDKRNKVEEHEGDSICARAETRIMLSVDSDDSSETEVDCSTEECRTYGYGDDVSRFQYC